MEQRKQGAYPQATQAFKTTYNHKNCHFIDSQKLNHIRNTFDVRLQRLNTEHQINHVENNNRQISASISQLKSVLALPKATHMNQKTFDSIGSQKAHLKTESLSNSRLYKPSKKSVEQLQEFFDDNIKKALNRERVSLEHKSEKNYSKHLQDDTCLTQEPVKVRKNSLSKNFGCKLKVPSNHVQNVNKLSKLASSKSSGPISPKSSVSRSNIQEVINKPNFKSLYHIDLEKQIQMEQELQSQLQLTNDITSGRVITIKLRDWFSNQQNLIMKKQKNENAQQLLVLNVVIKEFAKQLGFECQEKGQLLSDLWEKAQQLFKSLKFQYEVQKENDDLYSLNEFNRIHQMYRDKEMDREQGFLKMKEQMIQLQETLNHQRNDYQELKIEYGKVQVKLSDYKQICQYLKKRGEQLIYELENAQRREAKLMKNRINQARKTSPDNSPKKSLRKNNVGSSSNQNSPHRGQQEGSPSSKSPVQGAGNLLKLNIRSNEASDEEQTPVNNELGDILNDKNLVELNTMIMNMDKVVNVKDNAQQVSPDELEAVAVDKYVQTMIETIDSPFDLLFSSMERLKNTLEAEQIRQRIDKQALQLYEKLGQNINAQKFDNLIEQNFFQDTLSALGKTNESPSIHEGLSPVTSPLRQNTLTLGFQGHDLMKLSGSFKDLAQANTPRRSVSFVQRSVQISTILC